MSFWIVPPSADRGHPALLRRGNVHGPDDRGRAVDRHRGGDLVERQAAEQDLHVGQGGDGDAALAELADGFRRVRVVAVERGHVERDREARLALFEQVAEARVGFLGRAEPGEHAHGPQLAAVAGGVHAAGVGVAAGQAQVALVVEAGDIGRGVEPLDRDAGHRGEGIVALGEARLRPLHVRLLPLLRRLARPRSTSSLLSYISPPPWSTRTCRGFSKHARSRSSSSATPPLSRHPGTGPHRRTASSRRCAWARSRPSCPHSSPSS